ncbi:lactate racemase domain-containing protein [candidate division KSB1 bacterium]
MYLSKLPYEIIIPEMVRVKQKYDISAIDDIRQKIHNEFERTNVLGKIKENDKIAITAGSRGINRIDEILRIIIEEVKTAGGNPYILSAMGSHGGNTIDGQREILEGYGITEEKMKSPVICEVETVEIGKNSFGMPVYFDKLSMEADGIIAVNRIKQHTDYDGDIESGVLKMLAIGLGRRAGAQQIHELGTKGMTEVMPASVKVILEKAPVICGMGIVEDAIDGIANIEVMEVENIFEKERGLLRWVKENSPKFYFNSIDVLIVDEIGKNISGVCLDTNVIGRNMVWGEDDPKTPQINRIVALNLTDDSHGNALGVGLSDVITKRLYEKINFNTYYTNVMTSTLLEITKIPVIGINDETAIKIALKTCWTADKEKAKVARIKNTLSLSEILVSRTLLETEKDNKNIEPIGEFSRMEFDEAGVIKPFLNV